MRIRIANGVGLMRLVVALVIVLVVMSGSAFGQKKQSGRAVQLGASSGKKSEAVQQPIRKELEVKTQGEEVKVPSPSGGWQFDLDNPGSSGGFNPWPFLPGVNPFPSGGSGSTAYIERCANCSCEGDYAGPEFPDPKCNGVHKFHYEIVYTHQYTACGQQQHTDYHICKSGDMTQWSVSGTKYRFSNCSGVPDESEPYIKIGNSRTMFTQAEVFDHPICRQQ